MTSTSGSAEQRGGSSASNANVTAGAIAVSTPSRGGRNPSFRIPMPPPPSSPSLGSGSLVATPPLASSPNERSGGRFTGLVSGFRRNRGLSTNRGGETHYYANTGPPSPPVNFPPLAASQSLQDLPSPGNFGNNNNSTSDIDETGGAITFSTSPPNSAGGMSSSMGGSRGFFGGRRGLTRKNTLGGGGTTPGATSASHQRTPTAENPPPFLQTGGRSRSSSQPSLPLSHPANQGASSTPTASSNAGRTRSDRRQQSDNSHPHSANATSFFPETAASENTDALAASTATRVVPTSAANASSAAASAASNAASASGAAQQQHIRLVPHLESTRSLAFDPVSRDVQATVALRIGRFTERNPAIPATSLDANRITFKSKVVSRTHAEIWYDPSPPPTTGSGTTNNAGFFIRDLKSSSGTFLNHIRLSGAGMESRPFPLRDGDVLQLGVDYQGGTEEIYRCVKMRVELNRGWQRGANSFNTNAMRQLRALGNVPGSSEANGSSAPAKKTKKSKKDKRNKKGITSGDADGEADNGDEGPLTATGADGTLSKKQAAQTAASAGAGAVTDCCICLFSVTVYQALFIAPCSHIFHFKCIRPLLTLHHPGFSCPLCRTFADLEADVEQDDVAEPIEQESQSSSSSAEDDDDDEVDSEKEAENAASRNTAPPPLLTQESGVAAVAGASVFTDPDAANLDTLRPGKRPSPAPTPLDTSSSSVIASRALGNSTGTSSSPPVLPRTPNSSHSLSQEIADAFSPPSAGDFEPDIRRSSIFVQGADGQPMQIPVTGRSRPGSVYDLDMSSNGDGHHPPASSSSANRAKSVRSLRMSTTSTSSLKNTILSQGQSGSGTPRASERSPSSPASQHPRGHGHDKATIYHDISDGDDLNLDAYDTADDATDALFLDERRGEPSSTEAGRKGSTSESDETGGVSLAPADSPETVTAGLSPPITGNLGGGDLPAIPGGLAASSTLVYKKSPESDDAETAVTSIAGRKGKARETAGAEDGDRTPRAANVPI